MVGLISAIEAANAIPDPDTICLAAGSTYTLTTVNNTTSGANGLPPISTDITIVGNGATIARDPAAPPFRLLLVTPTGALTLEDVTLAGGLAGVADPGDNGGVLGKDEEERASIAGALQIKMATSMPRSQIGSDGARSIARIRSLVLVPKHVANECLRKRSMAA